MKYVSFIVKNVNISSYLAEAAESELADLG
jgi:hypothetical protein